MCQQAFLCVDPYVTALIQSAYNWVWCVNGIQHHDGASFEAVVLWSLIVLPQKMSCHMHRIWHPILSQYKYTETQPILFVLIMDVKSHTGSHNNPFHFNMFDLIRQRYYSKHSKPRQCWTVLWCTDSLQDTLARCCFLLWKQFDMCK